MIKGPLSVRGMLAWITGAGSIYFGLTKRSSIIDKASGRAGIRERDRRGGCPRAGSYIRPFCPCDLDRARLRLRPPRMTWLANLFTNWMGDDGFLAKMNGDLRVFNQVGDVTIFEGKVVKKYVENGKCCVDIEAWAKNQKDEWSMPPGLSTVNLPSRRHGPVVYPDPPASLVEDIKIARPLEEMIREGLI